MTTQGPWTVKHYVGEPRYVWNIYDAQHARVGTYYAPPSTNTEALAIDAANAQLIAAAPELLEACRAFVEWYPVRHWFTGVDALAIAQRAIAKAEGRS